MQRSNTAIMLNHINVAKLWGTKLLNYRKISLYIKWREVIPERRTAEEEFNGGTD